MQFGRRAVASGQDHHLDGGSNNVGCPLSPTRRYVTLFVELEREHDVAGQPDIELIHAG